MKYFENFKYIFFFTKPLPVTMPFSAEKSLFNSTKPKAYIGKTGYL